MLNELSRRKFLGVAATAAAGGTAGCNASGGSSNTTETTQTEDLEQTATETLEPTETEEPGLEGSLDEFSSELSENYRAPKGEELASSRDMDEDGDVTVTVDVDVDQVYDRAGIDIDGVNAFNVHRAGDLTDFAGDIAPAFLEDIFTPLMDEVSEYRSSNTEEGDSHSFINIDMHAAEDTVFSLTVDSDTAHNVYQNIQENPEKETSMMHMLLDRELATRHPSGAYEDSFYVAEGESETFMLEGRERTVTVDSVHTHDGKEWVDLDFDGEDTNYSTDEDAATIIDGWALERNINPSPYSEGVAFELVDDGLAAHNDCDPVEATMKVGDSTTYSHEGKEMGAELLAVTEDDTAVIRVHDGMGGDGYTLEVEEGETYSVGHDMNYEAESIINLEGKDGFVEFEFKEDDCYR